MLKDNKVSQLFLQVRQDIIRREEEVPTRQGDYLPGVNDKGEVIKYESIHQEEEESADGFNLEIKDPAGKTWNVMSIDFDDFGNKGGY